ncbi:MAG: iron dicitrate transport regulator FecR [Methylobacter sp.]|nr:MAG: iron dicitrate transport regulator FecR [Methylobacter sp.]
MNTPHNSHEDAIAEQAIAWFSRLRASSVSAKQRKQFAAWLAADPAHQKAYQQAEAFWVHPDFTGLLGEAELSPASAKAPPGRYWQPPVLLAMAASLVLMATAFRPTLECWRADYCTGVGETRTVHLADGSQVTLNSGTALNVAYQDTLRQAELVHGEAHFSVQRNPAQPFVVGSHYATARVLGTRFLVRQGQRSDTVTVINGLVEVSGKAQPPIQLRAHQQIVVGSGQPGTLRPAGADDAWLKGHALFDNVPLPEVLAELNRYRHGKIVIASARLNSLKVSGRFDIANTDHALQALQQTLPVRMTAISPWLVVVY